MEGVIDLLTADLNRSRLTDQNGITRWFDHGEMTDNTIKAHDAVSFTLTGTRITDVELLQKHRKTIVFSWT